MSHRPRGVSPEPTRGRTPLVLPLNSLVLFTTAGTRRAHTAPRLALAAPPVSARPRKAHEWPSPPAQAELSAASDPWVRDSHPFNAAVAAAAESRLQAPRRLGLWAAKVRSRPPPVPRWVR